MNGCCQRATNTVLPDIYSYNVCAGWSTAPFRATWRVALWHRPWRGSYTIELSACGISPPLWPSCRWFQRRTWAACRNGMRTMNFRNELTKPLYKAYLHQPLPQITKDIHSIPMSGRLRPRGGHRSRLFDGQTQASLSAGGNSVSGHRGGSTPCLDGVVFDAAGSLALK